MIDDYYKAFPDPYVKVCHDGEIGDEVDDGGGKAGCDNDEGDDDDNDKLCLF